ncbi:MAG: c-type cytochrome [Phycisphaerales bacterium]|nr:c-type cytochrome [Phycisphaerales bacterium]
MSPGAKGVLLAGSVITVLLAGAGGVMHLFLAKGARPGGNPVTAGAPRPPEVAEPTGPIDQALADMGDELVATKGCLTCHSTDGSPGTAATWRGLWGSTVRLEGGRSAKVTKAFILRSMTDPLADIHEGYIPQMPAYTGLLAAGEMDAIVEYIRSLAGEGGESGG